MLWIIEKNNPNRTQETTTFALIRSSIHFMFPHRPNAVNDFTSLKDNKEMLFTEIFRCCCRVQI